jgi:hypothetical protein
MEFLLGFIVAIVAIILCKLWLPNRGSRKKSACRDIGFTSVVFYTSSNDKIHSFYSSGRL